MKKNDVVFLAITCSLLIFAWIVFSIYHNRVTSTIPQTVETAILPIQPAFNTTIITKLKQRQIVNPVYTGKTPTPVATQSARLTATPTPSTPASSSGKITP